ncbi:hypothetical protein PG993_012397 [Apiospora rasikravindrae]|uniref:Uncharacterized protein n=1 Tax=Apiospora rasikravindrae TaxID=990691 RepID=A0ABR1S2E7_9PEZI
MYLRSTPRFTISTIPTNQTKTARIQTPRTSIARRRAAARGPSSRARASMLQTRRRTSSSEIAKDIRLIREKTTRTYQIFQAGVAGWVLGNAVAWYERPEPLWELWEALNPWSSWKRQAGLIESPSGTKEVQSGLMDKISELETRRKQEGKVGF